VLYVTGRCAQTASRRCLARIAKTVGAIAAGLPMQGPRLEATVWSRGTGREVKRHTTTDPLVDNTPRSRGHWTSAELLSERRWADSERVR